MNNKAVIKPKFLSYLLIVYPAALFTLIIPLHHHKDFTSHDNCADMRYFSPAVNFSWQFIRLGNFGDALN